MIKWDKRSKTLDIGTHWYIQFSTYIKGVWHLGVGYEGIYYCPSFDISLFKFRICIGRSKV